jgi:hypothetical protein
LGDWIEDAEVRLCIGATPCRPLPPTIVGGHIAVNKVLQKVRFAFAPINKQIFGEERGADHARAVVHESTCMKLSHCGINDRVPGTPFSPGVERFVALIPPDRVIRRFP